MERIQLTVYACICVICFPLIGSAQSSSFKAVLELPRSDEATIAPETIVKECSRYISSAPENQSHELFQAYRRRGKAYLNLKQSENAKRDFDAALKISPNDREAQLDVAVALAHLGKLDEGLRECRGIIERCPNYPQAYYIAGAILMVQKQYDSAIEYTDKAIKLDPLYPRSYYIQAKAYAQLGNYEKALTQVNRFIQLCPVRESGDPEEPYVLRGLVLLGIGRKADLEEAGRSFRMARRLNPSSYLAVDGLWSVYRLMNKHELCLLLAKELSRLDEKNPASYCSCAMSYLYLGNQREALVSANRALKLGADDPKVHLVLASCYLQSNEDKLALQHCARTLELSPDNEYALVLTAYLYATSVDDAVRDGKKAVEFATKANKLAKKQGPLHLVVLALAKAENGDFSEAQKQLEKASKLSTPPSELMKLLGRILGEGFSEGKALRHDAVPPTFFPLPCDRLDGWGDSDAS